MHEPRQTPARLVQKPRGVTDRVQTPENPARNDPTSTAVSPYSTRARPGAPVAMPLDWPEVMADLDSGGFTATSAAEHVARGRQDPWAELMKLRQMLPDLS